MPFCGKNLVIDGESIDHFDILLNFEGEPMEENKIGFPDEDRGFGFLTRPPGKTIVVLWYIYPDDNILAQRRDLKSLRDVNEWVNSRGLGSATRERNDEGQEIGPVSERGSFPVVEKMREFFQEG